MEITWVDMPREIIRYIIKMNPTLKDIHKTKMEGCILEINLRRKDYNCLGCTRITLFESGLISRRPSTRLFATKDIKSDSIVRVFGECIQHRTKNEFDTKIVIPRSQDGSVNGILNCINEQMGKTKIVSLHVGMDERDLEIRRSILDGNIHITYENIRRPRWNRITRMKIYPSSYE